LVIHDDPPSPRSLAPSLPVDLEIPPRQVPAANTMPAGTWRKPRTDAAIEWHMCGGQWASSLT
jgi:hypothetical protein